MSDMARSPGGQTLTNKPPSNTMGRAGVRVDTHLPDWVAAHEIWCSPPLRPVWWASSGRRVQIPEVWTLPLDTSWTWCCTGWGWWQRWGRRGRRTPGCSTGWSEQSPGSQARKTWRIGIALRGRAASRGWKQTPRQLKEQWESEHQFKKCPRTSHFIWKA